jgi:hypothetical protein
MMNKEGFGMTVCNIAKLEYARFKRRKTGADLTWPYFVISLLNKTEKEKTHERACTF